MSKEMQADERTLIKSAQSHLGNAKAEMKAAICDVQKVQRDLERAGLGCEAHDAFAAATHLKTALAAINEAHVKAGDRMRTCYPEDAGGIVLLGGGGR